MKMAINFKALRLHLILLGVMLFIGLIFGCTSKKEKANKLYNEAITLDRQGKEEESLMKLEEIVLKYPETDISIKANETLKVRGIIVGELKKYLTELKIKSIENALKLFYLDNGFYPSTEQGLKALLKEPTIGEIPMNWREDGYLENSDLITITDSWGNKIVYHTPEIYQGIDFNSLKNMIDFINKGIKITHFDTDTNTKEINVEGETNSFESVDNLVIELKKVKHKKYKDVKIKNVKLMAKNKIFFQIKIDFRYPDYYKLISYGPDKIESEDDIKKVFEGKPLHWR